MEKTLMDEQKENSVKTGEATAVLAAAIVSLLLSFMIRTVLLRIVFTSSFFLLMLMLVLLLCHDKEGKGAFLNLRLKVNVSWLIYCIAAVASIVMLILPATKYSLNESWVFFTSLNSSEMSRVVLGYFMLTVFPGYAAYRAFAKNKLSKSFERIAIVLALSYVISTLVGLVMSLTVGLTLQNYLLALWAFVLACEALSRVFKRKNAGNAVHPEPASFMKVGLMVVVCFLLVFSAYLITLSADPTDLALGGDVADYITGSNAFLNGHRSDSYYAWFQMFISVGSVLTGLNALHAFVGLQFLVVLFPLSFYTLLIRIFKNDKLAAVGTAITAVTCGLSSIGIVGLFSTYNDQSAFSALWTLRTKTQNWPWLSNHFFITSTLDWSLLMLSFGFAYSLFEGKQSKLFSLVMGSLFLAATFFTHGALGIVIFLMAVCVFALWNFKNLRRVVLFLIVTSFIILAFDIVSGSIFVNTVFNYYLHYQVFFASSSQFPYQTGLALLLILSLLTLSSLIVARVFRKRIKLITIRNFLSASSITSVCAVIAVLLTAISIVFITFNFGVLSNSEETIFPWYIYVVRFTPLLQIALLSIPILFQESKEARLGVWLMGGWIISAILIIALNIVFPRFVTPILVNRVIMSVYIPLGALSAFVLISLNKIKIPKIKFNFSRIFPTKRMRTFTIFLLAFLLSFSFLSYAYSIEIFYQGNMLGSMPNDEKNLYTYLDTIPKEKTLLTYSYTSYKRLSSLTSHPVNAYYQYGTFTSWSTEILFNTTSPETASYFLHKLGIAYIVLTKEDLDVFSSNSNNCSLGRMLNFFPVVFNNSFATVYSVPRYLLSESSNYLLVKPATRIGLDITNESFVANSLKAENLRIVGGPRSFRLENGTIIQDVQGSKPYFAQYLQLYREISIPVLLSPVVSFKIRGSSNAIYNIGFGNTADRWCWLSKEKGLPVSFFNATADWTEITINLEELLTKNDVIAYIDFLAASNDDSSAMVEWKDFDVFRNIDVNEQASNAFELAYGSLSANEVPFTIANADEVAALEPNHVYIFSGSWPSDISTGNLMKNVENGVHVVFFYNSIIFDQERLELLDSLYIEQKGTILANGFQTDEENVTFPTYLPVGNFTTQSSSYAPEIMSQYSTTANESVALVTTFRRGKGSITFFNLPKALNPETSLSNIAVEGVKQIVTALPTPNSSGNLKTLPYPEGLFTLGNPSLINIYAQQSLSNYVFLFSDIMLEGNVSMTSDYLSWTEKKLPVKELAIQNSTFQDSSKDVIVKNFQINSLCTAKLTMRNAVISCLGSEFPLVKAFSLSNLQINVGDSALTLVIEENGEEKSIAISRSSIAFEFSENFTTNMILHTPSVILGNGTVDASWKGAFWHNGKIFTTVATAERFPIIGEYSFQIVASDLLLLDNIRDINVSIRPSKYWTSE
jgi:hypothetical protein